jgi:hypothetical protein
VPLTAAALAGGATLAVTAAAAPKMLRIGKTDDHAELLAPLVEGFVKLSYVRLAFICASFAAMLWAAAIMTGSNPYAI